MTENAIAEITEAGALADSPETSAQTEQRLYVTFVLSEQMFAVEMAPVQEIIRVPEIVGVPLAPPALEGLANLRGKVLPIVSLRRALGLDERISDDSSRAIVINLNQAIGFVVDRVSSVIDISSDKIEGVEGISSTINTDLLSGLIKGVGSYPMIMVLNFSRLVEQEFSQIANQATSQVSVAQALDKATVQQEELSDNELHLVSFDVAGQEYAIAIENVQEIVQPPDQIVQVPHVQPHVLGVMTLRSKLLPLVVLRRMFGLPERSTDEQSRIVVVEIGNAAVGIVVDSVNEVLRVPTSHVAIMPALLAGDADMNDITDICQLDGGRRLVSVIAADKLFKHASIEKALSAVKNEQTATRQIVQDEGGDDEQVVVFNLHQEEFGVPIDSVQEIVRVPDVLTHVPQAPETVEGVINLRGTILPVLDLRRRLGIAPLARNDAQRIVVFMVRGVRTGFIVDAVAQVLKVPCHVIEPAPCLTPVQSKLLARVANLEKQKRMLQLIDPEYLLDDIELADMAEITA